jgi:hypothetical protein
VADRIVLNAYFALGHGPGGFRTWWRRLHDGSDETLDNTHLMPMAGRFARRVRAWAQANGVPVIDCKSGERKHRIAEEYLATHTVGPGVLLILVARAKATVYVACAAQAAQIAFTKEGNCFTRIADPAGLAQIADTLSHDAAAGRLSQVCDRWIYSACLCFALDTSEQAVSGFRYGYWVYQAEYSRNLLFKAGGQMDRVFNTVIDRIRSRLDVPAPRTLFGVKRRPGANGTPGLSPRQAVVIETPRWDLTIFKVHFGLLSRGTPKASACCVSRRSRTTPRPWGPVAPWRSSARSSPASAT